MVMVLRHIRVGIKEIRSSSGYVGGLDMIENAEVYIENCIHKSLEHAKMPSNKYKDDI